MAMLNGQVVYSVRRMPQGESYGLLLDPSSVPSVGLPSDQFQILSPRESDGMRLTTAESGLNNGVHFSSAPSAGKQSAPGASDRDPNGLRPLVGSGRRSRLERGPKVACRWYRADGWSANLGVCGENSQEVNGIAGRNPATMGAAALVAALGLAAIRSMWRSEPTGNRLGGRGGQSVGHAYDWGQPPAGTSRRGRST